MNATPLPAPHLHFSPDRRFAAFAGHNNTVIVLSTDQGTVLCTYYGHQEGVYHLTHERVTDIRFEYPPAHAASSVPTSIISTSTTGATHRWDLRGVHLATLQPAKALAAQQRSAVASC